MDRFVTHSYHKDTPMRSPRTPHYTEFSRPRRCFEDETAAASETLFRESLQVHYEELLDDAGNKNFTISNDFYSLTPSTTRETPQPWRCTRQRSYTCSSSTKSPRPEAQPTHTSPSNGQGFKSQWQPHHFYMTRALTSHSSMTTTSGSSMSFTSTKEIRQVAASTSRT